MLDVNILKLMFKEEFRLQASFFNRSYFLFSSLTIVLFTFIMGATLPMLRHAVAIDDLLPRDALGTAVLRAWCGRFCHVRGPHP
ncbi:MAG: hypothetical protein Q8M95_16250 [Candidatus Methanoperedens sp.]|nr:hypothetical protein [Candidatus Methanoperedens sp.]